MNPAPQPIRFQDLYIAQPCSEKWQDMDQRQGGAYCQHCKKEVTDFTNMTEAELNAVFATQGLGCGRFRLSQIGKPPVHMETPRTGIAAFLDRWQKGAAAAFLFLSLWQLPAMGKAEPKRVTCLVPARQQPHHDSGPNYRVSMVLLDETNNNLLDDIRVVLHLPGGDSIPIVTDRGFFSIDLEGRAQPEDTLTLRIPDQGFGREHGASAYFEHEIRFQLAQAQNLQHQIPTLIEHAVVMGAISAPLSTDQFRNLHKLPNRETPPLFRTRSPEEKAQFQADREARKASRASK